MKLENGAWYLQDAARKLGRYHPEMIRRVGVTILNVAGRSTPPNRGGMRAAAKQTGYGKANVTALKVRIAAEITGLEVLDPKSADLPSAIPLKKGRGYDWKGPYAWGAYMFRVPRAAEGKKSFPRVKYVDPMAVLKRRRFRRSGGVVRAVNSLKYDGIRWVKPKELLRAVKHYQARAGSLITAWYPAAQTLNASNASRDFKVSRFARPGEASLHQEGSGRAYLHMETDWSGLIVGERLLPHFASMVNRAAENGIRNTENWFLKKIFG